MIYENRSEAGKRLTPELLKYRTDDPIILALPRGGVVVAAEIALAFDAPLDLILVRKLGVPMQPELAMGAVVDGARPFVVRNEDILAQLDRPEKYFREVCERELDEIERRRKLYLRNRPHADLEDRIVIVVDEMASPRAPRHAPPLGPFANACQDGWCLQSPSHPQARLKNLAPRRTISCVPKAMSLSMQLDPTMRIFTRSQIGK